MNWVFVTTTAFLTECVAQQAAGAFALGNMLRNPGAAVAAVIIPTLVSKMGSGWCFTGLGIVDLVVVGSAVISEWISNALTRYHVTDFISFTRQVSPMEGC